MQNVPTIQNQLSSKDLFEAFKKQLAKDFEQSNFPTAFVDTLEPNYISILEKIASELKRSENKADFTIMNLLYRVDISETQLKNYLNKYKDENHFRIVAELIIKRVLQKVVIKHYYKSNENL